MSDDESSSKLWSGIRIWFPPNDPKGKWYITKYMGKREENGITQVLLKLIPEEEWLKQHVKENPNSSKNAE